jgi:hypothetical protein
MPEDGILRDYIHSQEATILDVDDPGIGMDVDNLHDFDKIKAYTREKTP